MCTLASVRVSRWWAQLEPINPAPPKITTDRKPSIFFISLLPFTWSFLRGQTEAVEIGDHLRSFVFGLLRTQPVHQLFHAHLKTDSRLITEQALCPGDIGKAVPDITRAIFF